MAGAVWDQGSQYVSIYDHFGNDVAGVERPLPDWPFLPANDIDTMYRHLLIFIACIGFVVS